MNRGELSVAVGLLSAEGLELFEVAELNRRMCWLTGKAVSSKRTVKSW